MTTTDPFPQGTTLVEIFKILKTRTEETLNRNGFLLREATLQTALEVAREKNSTAFGDLSEEEQAKAVASLLDTCLETLYLEGKANKFHLETPDKQAKFTFYVKLGLNIALHPTYDNNAPVCSDPSCKTCRSESAKVKEEDLKKILN